jgi:hypothetical protein
MKNSDEYEKMIADIASLSHEKFREIYREKNNGKRVKVTTDEMWIEKNDTNQADLAKLDYFELPKDWKESRWLGAKAAFNALLETINADKPLDDKFIEYASNVVHEEWLWRNRAIAEDEHKLSYELLSEDVKEKDRIFVRSAIEIYSKNPRARL